MIDINPIDIWSTPKDLFDQLDKEFNFNLDPCPLTNVLLFDGLLIDWADRRVFCNPPYSNIMPWIEKGIQSPDALVVYLLPSRTGRPWFQKILHEGWEIRYLPGRLQFGGSTGCPFDSIVVIKRAYT